MKKFLTLLASSGLILFVGFGNAMAQEEGASDPATPVEIFACNYADGKGPADLDAVVKRFNDWGDKRDMTDYSAWTLLPYYASTEQDFDILWLGASPSGKSMGRLQDLWLAEGGKVQAMFDEVIPCNGHSNFATVQFRDPPEREDSSNIVITFSDCNISEGMNFGRDIAPALGAWAEYKDAGNSTAGMWVLFPAYGGGGEEFDFKYVEAYGNLEEQGVDWDRYSKDGWQKAEELFAGKLSCDSSRVYLATNRRMAEDDDE